MADFDERLKNAQGHSAVNGDAGALFAFLCAQAQGILQVIHGLIVLLLEKCEQQLVRGKLAKSMGWW